MQDLTGFGVITSDDIMNELVSRGITVGAELVEPNGTPVAPVVPPEGPEEPVIVVTPRGGPIVYEPYIPFYPPAVVTPDVTEEEEILPYIAAGEVEVKKGLSPGILAILGIAAFALIALGPQERARPRARPRRPRQRREPAEETWEPGGDYEEGYEEEVA